MNSIFKPEHHKLITHPGACGPCDWSVYRRMQWLPRMKRVPDKFKLRVRKSELLCRSPVSAPYNTHTF